MPGSGRAIICGGPPSPLIETFNISTLGNTVSFGSLILNAENWGGGCGNATRMLAADGGAASGYTTQISAIELASFGNASDFGDSTLARANQGALQIALEVFGEAVIFHPHQIIQMLLIM